MDNKDNIMLRGVQQSLYKYLPCSWVDFTKKSGSLAYTAHVDHWNSVHLININNRRLLRVINNQIQEYKIRNGENAVVNFPAEINEDFVDVLTPKISDNIASIVTSVNPWVFVCNKCGKVKQYYNYGEFKRNEGKKCDCGQHFTQLKMIRVCKCGYANGIFVPKCKTPGHDTKYMYRKGSGVEFYCRMCGQKANLPHGCPDCKGELKIKPALDSSNYIPFSVSLIDLLDKQKDVFLENESDCRGEKTVIAQYLNLIPLEMYTEILKNGKITRNDEFENGLLKEAEILRQSGLDEVTIKVVLDAKRKTNPNNQLYSAIDKISQTISIASFNEIKLIAEQILEYDELVNAKIKLTLDEAEDDAKIIRDNIRPNYKQISQECGFSNVQLSSGVPIIFSSYGFTRLERENGAKLHGFPREMQKYNVYASKLETEGVLFELDRIKILKWLEENDLIEQKEFPRNYDEVNLKFWFLDRIRPNLITTFSEINEGGYHGEITKYVYTLLHSIAHALINEASELCGLDKSSLSEYILPNIPAIFIYCSNSQGFNMGALYSAFQTQLDRWLKRAVENVKKCIFDPVCINKEKACAGCLFLNEVSCRHFNKDLDRSYLCGYFDAQKQKKLKGYWEK